MHCHDNTHTPCSGSSDPPSDRLYAAPLVGQLPSGNDPKSPIDRSGNTAYTVDSFKGLLERAVNDFASQNMALFQETNLTRMVDNYRKLANTSYEGWFGIYNFKVRQRVWCIL